MRPPILVWLAVLAFLCQILFTDFAGPAASAAQTEEEEAWEPPRPPAAQERVDERRAMVHGQLAQPSDSRDAVTAERVLTAMRTVPRHVFIPERRRARAYTDGPLPIGYGQTISQPYIVGKMTELLDIEAGDKVLEIGTGSGYQAAVLGQLTPEVYTIEIIDDLAARADGDLDAQGYADVKRRQGDGYFGWEEAGPFDAIIVTAAAGHVPPPLWEQLKPEGRMVIPIGGPYEVQRLILLRKTEEGKRRSRTVMAVRFVPMTGRVQEDP